MFVMSERRCAGCRRGFMPRQPHQKCCSRACRGRTGRQSAAWPVVPVMPSTAWQDEAACVGHPPEWWFPAKMPPGALSSTAELAKAICGRCPVRLECLSFAEATHQQFGIWGSLTATERAARRRRREVPR